MHAWVLPFVLCILNLSQKQRKESTDGQDILKLSGLSMSFQREISA